MSEVTPIKPFTWRRTVPAATTVAVLGIAAIVYTFAAGTPIAFEAESGTLAGGAATTSITGASGTGGVKFAAATTPTPTPSGARTCPAYPAMPDASCTGVPAGTSLTTLSGD